MSSPPDEVVTAYEKSAFIKNFEQKLPGEDAKVSRAGPFPAARLNPPRQPADPFVAHHPGMSPQMEPLAEHTKVERWTREGEPYLEEYAGKGLLKGKAAIVTGGDSGIGRTVAIFFAREGADVTISYLPEEEEDAQNVKNAVEAAGRKALLIPGDLRDGAVRQKVVDEHLKAFDYIDVLVNNASQQIQCKDIADIKEEDVESTFNSKLSLKTSEKKGGGRPSQARGLTRFVFGRQHHPVHSPLQACGSTHEAGVIDHQHHFGHGLQGLAKHARLLVHKVWPRLIAQARPAASFLFC